MHATILGLLVLTALITTVGQLLFKEGARIVAQMAHPSHTIIQKAFSILFEPHIFIGLVLYAAGLFLWIYLIARSELSIAYPINVALSILLTSIAASFLFQESFTLYKIFGIFLVIAGIFFLTTGKGF